MTDDDDAPDVTELAQTMIRHYGVRAHEMMLDRSRNCRRHNEPVSAAFWDLVAQEVRKISSAAGLPHRSEAPKSAGASQRDGTS